MGVEIPDGDDRYDILNQFAAVARYALREQAVNEIDVDDEIERRLNLVRPLGQPLKGEIEENFPSIIYGEFNPSAVGLVNTYGGVYFGTTTIQFSIRSTKFNEIVDIYRIFINALEIFEMLTLVRSVEDQYDPEISPEFGENIYQKNVVISVIETPDPSLIT